MTPILEGHKDKPLKTEGPRLSSPDSNAVPTHAPLLLAYYELIETVVINNRTAEHQTKLIQFLVNQQNRVIQEEAGFQFATLGFTQKRAGFIANIENNPDLSFSTKMAIIHAVEQGQDRVVVRLPHLGDFTFSVASMEQKNGFNLQLSAASLEDKEVENQEINALRTTFEDKLTVMRQDAQMGETNVNSAINITEQTVSEGANLMQILTSLTNQIARI